MSICWKAFKTVAALILCAGFPVLLFCGFFWALATYGDKALDVTLLIAAGLLTAGFLAGFLNAVFWDLTEAISSSKEEKIRKKLAAEEDSRKWSA